MATWQTPVHRELHRGLRDVVGAKTADEFAKLGIATVGDLVRHAPRRYIAGTGMSSFRELRVGQDVSVVAKVARTNVVYGNAVRVESTLVDEIGDTLQVTLFAPGKKPHVAEWWKGLLAPGSRGIFIGKVSEFNHNLQLTHPDFVMIDHQGRITAKKAELQRAIKSVVQRSTMVGLYPATGKLPTWSIAEAIHLVLPQATAHGDTLPAWVVEEAGQLPFDVALREVHEPVEEKAAEKGVARLRFDEAFGMQLAMAARRAETSQERAVARPGRPDGLLAAFDDRLPFSLTTDQTAVGEVVAAELAGDRPMRRLLQGEVGSGKTLVALRAMLRVVDSGGQAVLLAPTEVLAKQHLRSITSLLGDLGQGPLLGGHPDATEVALLTGSLSAAAKREALATIASGQAGIVIGTHALLSDPVAFADLGLVVIDEQHRFGVEQRAALSAKAEVQPHTLVMTATPIPRSIAMTVFGDLEVSEIRSLPPGRTAVQTVHVDTAMQPAWVARAWARIREEVAAGRQAFIVCPAITPKQADGELEPGSGMTAVTELLPELESGPLMGLRLAMVHGKQQSAERDATMTAFAAGELDVLVATTVIEVGVDVPNATVMVVMDADRFGISQLHQLRGRIGRGAHGGLCLLLAAAEPGSTADLRLGALVASTDGFELAERDLELRREGDVLGAAQSGASSLRLLRVLADRDVIVAAKALAERVVADPRSAEDPLLADLMAEADDLAAGDWLGKD